MTIISNYSNSLITLQNSRDLLDVLITTNSFYHVYQPIYSLLTNRLIGYEALLRSERFTPAQLLLMAEETNRSYELDTASIYAGISIFNKGIISGNCPLFVNVLPSTLLHPNFVNFIKQLEPFLFKNKIIFELNECGCIKDYDRLKQIIFYLRQKGVRIALDDVGAGNSSVPRLIAFEPEILKLDLSLAQNLSQSKVKQRLTEMFVHYCQNDITLILEGIENANDLAVAKSLGISIGQGYLLGKPRQLGNLTFLSIIEG